MPIGLLIIIAGIIFLCVGKSNLKISDTKKYNESTLPLLSESVIDECGDVWEAKYKYEAIDIKLVNCVFSDFKAKEIIEFAINSQTPNTDDIASILVMSKGKIVGYINTLGQRCMIYDFIQREGHFVKAQISFISKENVFLRIYYYISKSYAERVEKEQKAQYEAEKAAYVRKPPVSFKAMLVYNKNAEMQSDIQCVEVGEIVCFEQDEDDRYLAVAKRVLYLGYLPKKLANQIDELLNDGYEVVNSKITKKEYDDSYRYVVEVSISLEDTNYL